MKYFALCITFAIFGAGCKTAGQNTQSESKDIKTGYYTLMKEHQISGELKEKLNKATGYDVCYGDFYNDKNAPTSGIYLCAHGPNDIRPGTGLLFENRGGLLYNSSMVISGRVVTTNGQTTLAQMCTGQYDHICAISFNPDKQAMEFKLTVSLNQKDWTFSVVTKADPRNKLEAVLNQIDGHKICFGFLKHDIGYNYGIYICDDENASPKGHEVVLVYGEYWKANAMGAQIFGRDGVPYAEVWPIQGSKKLNLWHLCDDAKDYPCEIRVHDGNLVVNKKF